MGYLFNADIDGWESWSRLFQSKELFEPLVREIFRRHGLSFEGLSGLTPGTNAVFRCGGYVVKLAAPEEVGFGDVSEEESESIDETGVQLGEPDWIDLGDIAAEIFATDFAAKRGVSTPEPVASGTLEDKYRFDYLVTRFISGEEFTQAVRRFSPEEKRAAGKMLRGITDRLNVPCPEMKEVRGTDILRDATRHRRWSVYPERFRRERMERIFSRDFGERVLVHGDLCGDNILVGEGGLWLIDFADSVLAPRIYEHALIAIELFDFDAELLHGYFGGAGRDELVRLCADGMLIHDYGADILKEHVAMPERFTSLEALDRLISEKLKEY